MNADLLPDRNVAMWPEPTPPFALFGKRYVWVRECPTGDMLAPGFDYRRLPLTLHRLEP